MVLGRDVHERTRAVDRAIDVAPAPAHLEVCPIHVPNAARRAAPAPAQVLGQFGGELGTQLARDLLEEQDAAQGEHLGQVAQRERLAQPPEHPENDDVRRISRVSSRPKRGAQLFRAGFLTI